MSTAPYTLSVCFLFALTNAAPQAPPGSAQHLAGKTISITNPQYEKLCLPRKLCQARPQGELVTLACLLLHTVSPRYAAVILADLRESVPPHRFWRELLRSLPPVFTAELRRADCRASALLTLLSSFAAPLLIDSAWSAILSHIPLKDRLARNADFLILHIFLTALLALMTGAFSTPRAQLLAIPASTVLTTAALSLTRGTTPACFAVALIFTTALFTSIGACKLRRQTS